MAKVERNYHVDRDGSLILEHNVVFEGRVYRASSIVTDRYGCRAAPAEYVDLNLRQMVMREIEEEVYGRELTPWVPGHIKPARPGVYQQFSGLYLGYQRWDGEYWYSWDSEPEIAAKCTYRIHKRFQDDTWRGLANEPTA